MLCKKNYTPCTMHAVSLVMRFFVCAKFARDFRDNFCENGNFRKNGNFREHFRKNEKFAKRNFMKFCENLPIFAKIEIRNFV
jgi:hypothetical protein